MGIRDDAKNAFLRGMREFNFGDKDKALALFEDSIKLFDLADGWLGKGMVLKDRGQTAEAMAAFCRALNARPDYARAWWHKAILFKEIGEMDRALRRMIMLSRGTSERTTFCAPLSSTKEPSCLPKSGPLVVRSCSRPIRHLKALELFEQANSQIGAHPRLLLGMSLALLQLGRQKEGESRLIDAWQVRDRTTDLNVIATIENGLRSFGIEAGER